MDLFLQSIYEVNMSIAFNLMTSATRIAVHRNEKSNYLYTIIFDDEEPIYCQNFQETSFYLNGAIAVTSVIFSELTLEDSTILAELIKKNKKWITLGFVNIQLTLNDARNLYTALIQNTNLQSFNLITNQEDAGFLKLTALLDDKLPSLCKCNSLIQDEHMQNFLNLCVLKNADLSTKEEIVTTAEEVGDPTKNARSIIPLAKPASASDITKDHQEDSFKDYQQEDPFKDYQQEDPFEDYQPDCFCGLTSTLGNMLQKMGIFAASSTRYDNSFSSNPMDSLKTPLLQFEKK